MITWYTIRCPHCDWKREAFLDASKPVATFTHCCPIWRTPTTAGTAGGS